MDHEPKGYFPIAWPNIPNGTILLSLKEESYGKVFHTRWGWINEIESEHWTLLGNSFGEYITSFKIVDGGIDYPTSI